MTGEVIARPGHGLKRGPDLRRLHTRRLPQTGKPAGPHLSLSSIIYSSLDTHTIDYRHNVILKPTLTASIYSNESFTILHSIRFGGRDVVSPTLEFGYCFQCDHAECGCWIVGQCSAECS